MPQGVNSVMLSHLNFHGFSKKPQTNPNIETPPSVSGFCIFEDI